MSQRLNYPQLSKGPLAALMSLEQSLSGALDPILAHLVKIRVSQINGCLFCLDMHSKEAKKSGERELRLYHLSIWHESPLFTAQEKAALAWAEILTNPPTGGVPNEAFERVREHFSEKEVSDLTFVISGINAWNRLGIAFTSVPGTLDKMLGLDQLGLK